jgi:hypothetical protein
LRNRATARRIDTTADHQRCWRRSGWLLELQMEPKMLSALALPMKAVVQLRLVTLQMELAVHVGHTVPMVVLLLLCGSWRCCKW